MKFSSTSLLLKIRGYLERIGLYSFYKPPRLVSISFIALVCFLLSEPIAKSSFSLTFAGNTLKTGIHNFEETIAKIKADFFLNISEGFVIDEQKYLELETFAASNNIQLFIKDEVKGLVFWSTDKIDVEGSLDQIPLGYSLQKLNNGYHVTYRFNINSHLSLIALDWLKKGYQVDNSLFSNNFADHYQISSKFSIDFIPFEGSIPIEVGDKILFHLGIDEQQAVSETLNIKIVLWLVVVICLALALVFSLKEVVRKSNYWFALLYLSLFVGGIRLVNVLTKLPKIWYYDWRLFDSSIFYLDAFTPSLGDFILNSLSFLGILYFLYRNVHNFAIPSNKRIQYCVTVLFILVQFFIVDFGVYCFKQLCITSNIYLDVNNILSFNWLSVVSYLSLTIYFFFYYFYINFLAEFVQRFKFNREEIVLTVAFGLLVSFIYQVGTHNLSIVYLANAMYLIAIIYQKRKQIDNYQFRYFAVLIIGFSLVCATKLFEFNELKQEKIQEQEAIKIEKIGLKKTTFDDLINNTSTQELVDKSNFSYALFHNKELVKKVGEYNYNRRADFDQRRKYTTFIQGGYIHYVNRVSSINYIIVSRKEKTLLNMLSTLSFFFALSTLLYFILISLTWLRKNMQESSFLEAFKKAIISFRLYKFQIQLYIFSSVLLFITLLILITFNYIEKSFIENQKSNLLEKVEVIKSEVKNLDTETINSPSALGEYINTVARSFNIDIYCYGTDGVLKTKNNKGLVKAELISNIIKPQAFINLIYNKRGNYFVEDNIEHLSYFACYSLLEYQEKVIGYIFVPYYKNQNEYSLKLSTLANSLINIYVLIISLISFISFFISQRLVEPIETLEHLMSKVKLGGINEHIDWKRQDEFGKLIKEYNKMIDELEFNAQKLAKSEREDAWRQMAKQIAHEIKNPLTPLKLGLQHLDRAHKSNSPQFDLIFTRFTQTFLNQIQSLEHIVNQFSNFAQFSSLCLERLDVREELLKITDLYTNQSEAEIFTHIDKDLRSEVLADADHLMRSIGNIIKNGIQAIPEDQVGEIHIYLRNVDDKIEIEIKDNGTGIPDDVAERVFEPNFTTKNSGMGLGLAIIQKSISEMGGNIRFKTMLSKGTSFYITLPLFQE